jgi:MFS superfamily sulfate permease-like transporter
MAMAALCRELGAALLFKALALAIIYFAFFGASHKVIVSPDAMATFLFQDNRAQRR